MSADARVPVTVVTGALGAGKSTLLSRWLASGGERLALIVNELGDVPLDGLLIRRADEDLIELSNGCVCCTVRGDLVRTATELLRRRERWLRPARFDRIVIETSGLAAPGPVVQSFLIDPELAARTRPDGVIALVHAQHLARQLTEEPIVAEQLASADLAVLNHLDRVNQSTADQAEATLRSLSPLLRVHRATHADVPLTALVNLEPSALPERASEVHRHDVVAISLTATQPVDLHRLKLWLHHVAARKTWQLLRLKAVVRCADRPRAVVAQGVYEWLELGPSALEPPEVSAVVLIGRGLDGDELKRGWAAVLRA